MVALPFATRLLFPKPFFRRTRIIRSSLSPPQMDPSDSQPTAQAHANGPINPGPPNHHQNVVVMRHGHRLDNFAPLWVSTAARPWDPPLYKDGLTRAFNTGRDLRNNLGFPIHRVFVSPFLRCVQTAGEAISGLVSPVDDPNAGAGPGPIDTSKVKVSIEYGLCEMLNHVAIRPQSAPKDGEFGFKVSELEALFPDEIVDSSVEPVYKELPKWPEEAEAPRNRYLQVIKALADKYPTENLLLVTHGEGVGVAVNEFMGGVTVYEVDYCGYAILKRPVFYKDESYTAGEFRVQTNKGLSRIRYLSSSLTTDDVDEVPE